MRITLGEKIWSMLRSAQVNEVRLKLEESLRFQFVITSQMLASITGVSKTNIHKIFDIHGHKWLDEIHREKFNAAISEIVDDKQMVANEFLCSEYFQFLVLRQFQTSELVIVSKYQLGMKLEVLHRKFSSYGLQFLTIRRFLEELGINDENIRISGVPLVKSPLLGWLIDYVLEEYKHIYEKTSGKLERINLSKEDDSVHMALMFLDQRSFPPSLLEKVQIAMIEADRVHDWFLNIDRILIEMIKAKVSGRELFEKDYTREDYYYMGQAMLKRSQEVFDGEQIRILSDLKNQQHYLLFEDNLVKLIETIELKFLENDSNDIWIDIQEFFPDYHSMNHLLKKHFKEILEKKGHAVLQNGRLLLAFPLQAKNWLSRHEKLEGEELDKSLLDILKTTKIREPMKRDDDRPIIRKPTVKAPVEPITRPKPAPKLSQLAQPTSKTPPLAPAKPVVSKPMPPEAPKRVEPVDVVEIRPKKIRKTVLPRFEEDFQAQVNLGISNRPYPGKDQDRHAILHSRDKIMRGMIICDGVSNSGKSHNGDRIGGAEAAKIAIKIFSQEISSKSAGEIRLDFPQIIDNCVNKVKAELASTNSESKTTYILMLTDGHVSYMSYLGDGSIIQLRSDGVNTSAHHLFAHKSTSKHLSGFLGKDQSPRRPTVMVHNLPMVEDGIYYVLASDGMGFPSGMIPKLFGRILVRNLVTSIKRIKSGKTKIDNLDRILQSMIDDFLKNLDQDLVSDDITLGLVHLIGNTAITEEEA